TSMRVPAPDELAGGARGTARAPRASGAPRPGSARHRAEQRRRRLRLTLAAAATAIALAIAGYTATQSDTPPPSAPGQQGPGARP
ncbi:serine/threonine protein kinase, partial [Streptomyces sp. CAI-78]|nr:serine/threonine protein kinase [Streptomyces sp. CAI-78]